MIQDVQIERVRTSKDLREFVNLPYSLNRSLEHWVPPLRMSQKENLAENHPFWRKNPHSFFLAWLDGRCVGRIAAFVNLEHNQHTGRSDGFFGFLEAIDNKYVFQSLLDEADRYVKAKGCSEIIGPMNPSIHYELGVLVDGFQSPPYMMMSHNYLYYDACIRECGFEKKMDFYSYLIDVQNTVPGAKMERVKSLLVKRYPVSTRPANIRKFDQELGNLFEIYNDAFRDHWGFVPVDREEFAFLAKDMKSIIDPRLVFIAEYAGEPVAFLLCVPNLNEILARIGNGRLLPFGWLKILMDRRKLSTARVITVAVKKQYQHLGFGAVLYPELMKATREAGYKMAELSWVVENNKVMNAIAEETGAAIYKTYRLYTKTLNFNG